jgi:tetratricopeptide (TPR) repeat protein
MIAALAALLVGAAGIRCAAVSPAAQPDPETATEYRAVAEEELSRGDVAAAAAAFRRAAALDPEDRASRAELERLCAVAAPAIADPFAAGIRRMDAGDCRGAIDAFVEARARGSDPALDLVEGACRAAVGDDARGEALLRSAERDPASRAAARLHLGILALRAGDATRAAALLEDAGRSPALAGVANDLSRLAQQEGRMVVAFTAETGWDSNVTLAPAARGSDADAALDLGLAGLWRPGGSSGPYLRAAGRLHQQATLDAYDLGAIDAGAGWQVRGRDAGARLEYAWLQRWLAGADYLQGHQLLADAWVARGALAFGASALVRREAYTAAYDPYSGVLARGELRALGVFRGGLRVTVAYDLTRDATDAGSLAFLEHGPRVELRVPAGRTLRLVGEAGLAFRAYDERDPVLGVLRDDHYLDGAAALDWELGPRWSARAGLQVRRATSTVPMLEYTKVVPAVGISWTAGR